MPNLHFACDFVFDVTGSLLIMQWTRREYMENDVNRRPFSSAPETAIVFLFLLFFASLSLCFSAFLSLLCLFIYLSPCNVRFHWRAAIAEEKRRIFRR